MLAYLRKYLNTDKLLLLYNTFIQSHFLYCIPVWGNPDWNHCHLDKLLILQKKIVRIITFAPILVGAKVHTPPIFHKLRILTIYEIAKFRRICLAQQIIAGNYQNLNVQMIFITNFHNHPTRYSENKTLWVHYTNTSIGWDTIHLATRMEFAPHQHSKSARSTCH